MTTENIHLNKGRRKPKVTPIVFRYSISFMRRSTNKFVSRFERSRLKDKARFITSLHL